MRILIIFVMTVTVCYAKNNQLKSPLFRCNPFQKTGVDSPFEQGPFNIMENYLNRSLEDIPGEIWKAIPRKKGYEASTKGRIKSLSRIVRGSHDSLRKKESQIVAQWLNKGGYCMVDMWIDGIRSHGSVHRLVLEAFQGESELSIDHVDENPKNNCLENLEYVTQRENVQRYFSKTRDLPLGIHQLKNGKFKAMIRVDNILHSLGCYIFMSDAVLAHTTASADLKNIHLYSKRKTKS